MTTDKFGLMGLGVLTLGWLLGVVAAEYFNSLWVAAGVALGVPTLVAIIGAAPVSRAWWAANRQEAAKPEFGNEARTSLRFVVLIGGAMGLVMGANAFSRGSPYWASFAGSLLAMSVFAGLRLRDLAARNFK